MSQQHCWFFQSGCGKRGAITHLSALPLAEARYLTRHFKDTILRGGVVIDLQHICCSSQIFFIFFQLINAHEREVFRQVSTPGRFSHVGSNMRQKKINIGVFVWCLTTGSVPDLNGESVEVVEHDMVWFWEQRRVTLERRKKV